MMTAARRGRSSVNISDTPHSSAILTSFKKVSGSIRSALFISFLMVVLFYKVKV